MKEWNVTKGLLFIATISSLLVALSACVNTEAIESDYDFVNISDQRDNTYEVKEIPSEFLNSDGKVMDSYVLNIEDGNSEIILDSDYFSVILCDENRLEITYKKESGYGIAAISEDGLCAQYLINKTEKVNLDKCNNAEITLYSITKSGKAVYDGNANLSNVEVNNKWYIGESYYSDYSSGYDLKMLKALVSDIESRSSTVYEYINNCFSYIEDMEYDDDKAYLVLGSELENYKPNIGNIIKEHKGICIDKSALFASMLRIKGIHTKVVFGYFDGGYHSWNEVLLSGDWYMFDTTVGVKYNCNEISSYVIERYS